MYYKPKEYLEQDLRYKGEMRRRYDVLLEVYKGYNIHRYNRGEWERIGAEKEDDNLIVEADTIEEVKEYIDKISTDRLYEIIENARENNNIIANEEDLNFLATGFLISRGTMSSYGIVFTINDLFWKDTKNNIYQVLLGITDNSLNLVGSVEGNGLSSGNTKFFKKENRLEHNNFI